MSAFRPSRVPGRNFTGTAMQRDFWTLRADGQRKRFVFVWDAKFGGLARLEGLVRDHP